MIGLEGASKQDLIEAINDRDRALAEMSEINKSLATERDYTKRQLEWFQNRCLEYMKEKAAWESREGTA